MDNKKSGTKQLKELLMDASTCRYVISLKTIWKIKSTLNKCKKMLKICTIGYSALSSYHQEEDYGLWVLRSQNKRRSMRH